MRRRTSRFGIVVVSMFALLIGSSVSYSQGQTAQNCMDMEAWAGRQALDLKDCAFYGDCGEIEISLNNWNCWIAECWDAVDGVCSAD